MNIENTLRLLLTAQNIRVGLTKEFEADDSALEWLQVFNAALDGLSRRAGITAPSGEGR